MAGWKSDFQAWRKHDPNVDVLLAKLGIKPAQFETLLDRAHQHTLAFAKADQELQAAFEQLEQGKRALQTKLNWYRGAAAGAVVAERRQQVRRGYGQDAGKDVKTATADFRAKLSAFVTRFNNEGLWSDTTAPKPMRPVWQQFKKETGFDAVEHEKQDVGPAMDKLQGFLVTVQKRSAAHAADLTRLYADLNKVAVMAKPLEAHVKKAKGQDAALVAGYVQITININRDVDNARDFEIDKTRTIANLDIHKLDV